jgi:hypothetical protein
MIDLVWHYVELMRHVVGERYPVTVWRCDRSPPSSI